jgi:phospholipase C
VTRLRLAVLAVLIAALAAAIPGGASSGIAAAADTGSPTTPIKHVITLMQENHTFDNYFGTYPGADGIPAGVCMPKDPVNPAAGCVPSFAMENRPALDLDHSRTAFETQFNGGKLDGFIAAQDGAESTMGYYDDTELPYYWNIADEFVLFDRFFTASGGGSLQNHFYWFAGNPGVGKESIPAAGVETATIFDRLDAAGLSWKFYIQNYDREITFRNLSGLGDRASQVVWAPLLTMPRYLDDPALNSHIVDLSEYYTDVANGTLPAVAYLVPSGASEHPPGSLLSGQRFVQGLINALVRSDAWKDSLFTWTYDDWGGWYDHVVPPQVDEYGYGFRAPALLVSSYAKRGYIDSTTLDFTSIMKFIEVNWRLDPVADRDAKANTFMDAFDFAAGPRAPFYVSNVRTTEAEISEPNRAVLYGAYTAAIGLAVMLIVGAAVAERSRPGRRPTRPPAAR